jgi:spermidine synthase
VSIARRYFQLPAADGRLEIRVCDAARFMALPGDSYDAILSDGYDGDSLVEALSSRAFFGACLRRLAPRGVAAINLWGSDRRFDEYLARFEAEFPAGTLCLPAEKPGNVIAFGFRDAPGELRWDELEVRAAQLETRYDLEFGRFVGALRRMNRCNAERLYPGTRP